VGKDGFTFKAVVTVRTEAKIGTYKGLMRRRKLSARHRRGHRKRAQALCRARDPPVNVEREAKMGDTVLLDFEGFDNGVPFGAARPRTTPWSWAPLLCSGFEEGVVGLKPGDEKDIDVTFPEDYHADLAGKPVVFKIKVHEVKEPQAPVVDDEFAKTCPSSTRWTSSRRTWATS
jgi:trigger factor